MLDVEKLVGGVHDYIERAFAPLVERVRVLESRQLERGEKGDPGRDGKDGAPGLSVKGDPGGIGDRGEKGEAGETPVIITDQGPPLNAGKGGDVYIDVMSGDIYRCI